MVTTFNKKDMVGFGNYLLSEERRKRYLDHPMDPKNERLEERLSEVNHADLENWKNDKNEKQYALLQKLFEKSKEVLVICNTEDIDRIFKSLPKSDNQIVGSFNNEKNLPSRAFYIDGTSFHFLTSLKDISIK